MWPMCNWANGFVFLMKQLCIHACLSAALLFLIVGVVVLESAEKNDSKRRAAVLRADELRDRPILRPFYPRVTSYLGTARLLVAVMFCANGNVRTTRTADYISNDLPAGCWCDFFLLFPAGPQNGQQQKRGRYSIPTLQSSFSLCSIGRPLFAVPLVPTKRIR